MKSVLYFIVIGCMMLCFTACSTSTKFTVYGDPGTQILTPSKSNLATIDITGKAKITNPDDNYYAFLLSHKPGTNEYIPFALDYKKKTYYTTNIVNGIGAGVTCIGAFMSLVGGAALLFGAEDVGSTLFLSSLGAVALGGGMWFPASSCSDQSNQKYHYKYNPVQKTNQDIQFTKAKFDVYKPKNQVTQDNNAEATSKTNKNLSSSDSRKSLKDNAAKIEGTYIGKGVLKHGNEIIEAYNEISISIKRKSKDIVLVNVIESDGSKFFTSDGEYTIKKLSNGKYILKLKGINNAGIEIDTKYNLKYIHPRVNIDGEIYNLSINAKK